MNETSQYDVRSLQHERRMLEVYRHNSVRDIGLLQPLANACWRASAFEWQLNKDSAAIRSLWAEGARALTDAFARRRLRVGQAPDQLQLALQLSIASRSFELVGRLTHLTAEIYSHHHTGRSRSKLLLLEAYLTLTRAIFERRPEPGQTILRLIDEAALELQQDVRKELFVSDLELAWKAEEHTLTCSFLRLIANLLSAEEVDLSVEPAFASLMDRALKGVNQFVEAETNHRPKYYFWLPGVALTVLADAAGLSLDWLHERHRDQTMEYTRLPLELVQSQNRER